MDVSPCCVGAGGRRLTSVDVTVAGEKPEAGTELCSFSEQSAQKTLRSAESNEEDAITTISSGQ